MAQRKNWGVWIALVLVLATTLSCQRSPQNAPAASATAEPIEEFTAETLSQYQGKIVVLNFWATWCQPCRKEMPDLEAIYRKYRDQGLVILAVNAGEDGEAITAFVSQLDLTFPILRDSQRQARDAYGIRVLPTTLFLNRDGQEFARELGGLDQKAVLAQIEPLLQ